MKEKFIIKSKLPKELTKLDLWWADGLQGASWCKCDIPYCPTTSERLPNRLISISKAKTIHNKAMKSGDVNYHVHAFVHCYVYDQHFDGKRNSIWDNKEKYLDLLKHFDGAITPDFSTFVDFPDPIQRYNTLRMRAMGYYLGKNGISVINNVRWGVLSSYDYCFEGIDKGSIVSVGTSANNLHIIDNRPLFEGGFKEMIKRLEPKTIIIYGSDNNVEIEAARKSGIEVVRFLSETHEAHLRSE